MCANIENWNAGGLCDSLVTPTDQMPDMHATALEDVRQAEFFCKPCRKITPCYEYGLANPSERRVFGGASYRRRRAILRFLKDNPGTIPPPQPRG